MATSILAERETTALGGNTPTWDGGNGSPLLFLHGFDGNPGPIPFLEHLATSHRVIAPTHPGFDEADDNHAVEDIVDLALLYRGLIEAEASGSVDLVGHSMGAMIAAEVAALSPQLVRRLVLLNPFGFWLDEAPIPDFFVMTPGELRRASWTEQTAPGGNGQPATPDKAAMVRRYRNFGAASRYLWPIPDRGLRKRSKYIQAPTLAMFGESDGLIPTAHAAVWADALPNCRAEVVPGSHMLPFERPEAMAHLVAEFLGGAK